MTMRRHSWKTTLGGALGGFGLALIAIDPAWLKIGLVISALGQFFNGLFARDNNRSSQDAGVRPQAEPAGGPAGSRRSGNPAPTGGRHPGPLPLP